MKSVALIAPEFPPANTAGAHRPRLFAQHLSSFGWAPIVLTVRPDVIEGPLDPLLERLVDPAVRVIRTGALPVRPVRLIGDLGLRTIWSHARALAALAGGGELDAVALFGPPWFSFVLGPFALKRFGLPYVIDYIDPWRSDWTATHRFPGKGWLYERAAAAIEPRVLGSASHITAVSEGILADLRQRYGWLDASRMTAMPYGAEPDDLSASARLGVTPPDFSRGPDLTLCFTGAIQPKSGLLLDALLDAVRRLRDGRTTAGRRVVLRAYGTSNLTWGHGRHSVKPIADARGIGDVVSEMPERIPYLQAMAVLHACDIVVVMGSTDAYYHASKLYPAIVSGRPVLAICHADSSISRVMRETNAGIAITFSHPEQLADKAAEIADAIDRLATARPSVNAAAIARFTARASAQAFAGILDSVAGSPAYAEAM